jgi:hypothetical protein
MVLCSVTYQPESIPGSNPMRPRTQTKSKIEVLNIYRMNKSGTVSGTADKYTLEI